jgi:DNA-3-methyladenine glycosylase II
MQTALAHTVRVSQPTLLLKAPEGFRFEHTLSFLCSFGPTRGEQAIESGSFSKAYAIDGRAVVVRLREAPGGLRCVVRSDDSLSRGQLARLTKQVRFQLGLDEDLTSFLALAEADPYFAPIARRWRGHHHVKFASPFEIAIWAVLAQRNQRLGRRIKDALVQQLGPAIEIDGAVHRAFPEPERFLDGRRVRGIVGDDAKADAMLAIARSFMALDVERTLIAAPYEEADAFLRKLPRIGPWSSAFILFRGLGRMHALADASGPIIEAARRTYGPLSEKEIRSIAASYGEWCGYWALYLRRS